MSEKEWLLMVKVRADKDRITNLGNIECVAVETEHEELGYFQPSRLIDPADLEYRCPNRGDIFFNLNGEWIEAGGDYAARCLVLHKPKPDKWQAWEEKCPLTEWTSEMRKKLTDWIIEGMELKEEE